MHRGGHRNVLKYIKRSEGLRGREVAPGGWRQGGGEENRNVGNRCNAIGFATAAAAAAAAAALPPPPSPPWGDSV